MSYLAVSLLVGFFSYGQLAVAVDDVTCATPDECDSHESLNLLQKHAQKMKNKESMRQGYDPTTGVFGDVLDKVGSSPSSSQQGSSSGGSSQASSPSSPSSPVAPPPSPSPSPVPSPSTSMSSMMATSTTTTTGTATGTKMANSTNSTHNKTEEKCNSYSEGLAGTECYGVCDKDHDDQSYDYPWCWTSSAEDEYCWCGSEQKREEKCNARSEGLVGVNCYGVCDRDHSGYSYDENWCWTSSYEDQWCWCGADHGRHDRRYGRPVEHHSSGGGIMSLLLCCCCIIICVPLILGIMLCDCLATVGFSIAGTCCDFTSSMKGSDDDDKGDRREERREDRDDY